MKTKKLWAPCSDVTVDHVARRESGGWIVSGTLVPKGIQCLADLAQAALIHLNAEDNRWTTWQSWFAALGNDGKLGAGHWVNNYAIALQASQDGMGAVLGWEVLSGHFVRSRTLNVVLPDSIAAPHDVHIRTSRTASTRALLLRDWLVTREHPGK
ncbi:MAG: LysR substrate-binding domain-containing protein [Paracoccaceae bacterium]